MRRVLEGPIARGTINTAGVLLLRLLVQAATLVVVTRMLGPVHFGAYAGIAALAILLGSLASFGTHLVLLGEASRDPGRRDTILPYALPTCLLAGGMLIVPYLLLGIWVTHHSDISLVVIFSLGAAELLFQPLVLLASTEHHAHGKIARSQLLMTLPLALRLLVAIAVWIFSPVEPLMVFALGYLLATGLALAISAWSLPEPWPTMRHWRLARPAELRQSIGYATLNLTALGPSELDKTLATKLMPLTAAGIYAAGARVIGALTLPVMAMLISAVPRLFRENEPHTGSSPLIRLLFGIALVYGLAAATLLWACAPIIALIFGGSYQGLDEILPWLALAVPAIALRTAAGAVLVTQSRPWIRAGFELLGLAVLIIAALALARSLPIKGMPLALAAAEWSMAISGWLLARGGASASLNRTCAEK